MFMFMLVASLLAGPVSPSEFYATARGRDFYSSYFSLLIPLLHAALAAKDVDTLYWFASRVRASSRVRVRVGVLILL